MFDLSAFYRSKQKDGKLFLNAIESLKNVLIWKFTVSKCLTSLLMLTIDPKFITEPEWQKISLILPIKEF